MVHESTGTTNPPAPDRCRARQPQRTRHPHHSPRALALVAAGGFLGAGAREAIAQIDRTGPGTFPATTLTINLTGAFALGLLLEALARAGADDGWRRGARLLAGTGFLGAYTTYSTLAVEADLLVRGGHTGTAALYALVSVIAGPLAAAAGIVVGAAGHRATRALPIDPDLDPDPDPDVDLDPDPDPDVDLDPALGADQHGGAASP